MAVDETLRETIAPTLADYPVAVGILFGSRARGEADEHSDIDVAVVFDGLEPGDAGYNDALLGLSADLAAALGTDAVDVVDLRRAPQALVSAAFEDGDRLVGTERDARRWRARLLDGSETESPAQRFDDVLAAIDDHLA
jgi:predicted nucleotidyltransferase